jgi:hypothetical protein
MSANSLDGEETTLSQISPLEDVVSVLFEKVYDIAKVYDVASVSETKNLEEACQEYIQRQKGLYEFFKELENNPFGFPSEEIAALGQRAVVLDQQLEMIGLYLDMIPHSASIVAESMDIYLKKHDMALEKVADALSYIENTDLRQALLKYNQQASGDILQIYSLGKIRKTVELLNQYFLEIPENKQDYNHLLGFLEKNGASWIPVGREIYETVLPEKDAPAVSVDNDVRLKQIERKTDAFELEVVPEEKKPVRLREIQGLKNELNKMSSSEKIITLQAKLEGLSKVLLPKSKGMGFFGGLKPANLMTA